MKLLLIFGGAVAAVGLFLLATASADTTFFAQQYPLLLALNAALAALLAGVVAFQLLALARRYRARVFGARLTLRLLMRFALLAVVPGLIVCAVSVQFITRSIESWFDVKVDAALEGGITLGQQAIDQTVLDMQAKARAMALELAGRSAPQIVSQLERLREQAGVQEATVLTASGRLIASASEDVTKLLPDLPGAQLLRQARANRGYAAVDSAAGRPLSLRVVVPMGPMALSDEARFLQLRQSVAPAFSRSLEAVEAAHRDYRELAISRDGLKSLAGSLGHPVYWAGPKNGYTYELTRTASGQVYLRYLPRGVKVGTKEPYLTVATYPFRGAFGAILALEKRKNAAKIKLAGGGRAVVDPDKKSIHLAYPGSQYEVEVFDPSPRRARQVVESGQISTVG